MQVSYQLNAAEFHALLRARTKQLRVLAPWLLTMLHFVVYFLPTTIVLLAFKMWYAIAVGAGLFAFLLVTAIRQSIRGRSTLNQLVGEVEKGLTTVRITPEQLEISSPVALSRRSWTNVERVILTKDFIFFAFSRLVLFGLPRRAFTSDEEAERFAALSESFMAQSRQTNRYAAAPIQFPSPDDFIQLRYRSTKKDFATILKTGLRKANNKSRSMPIWLSILLSLSVGTWSVLSNRDDGRVGQVIAGFAAYLCFGIPTIVLVKWVHMLRLINLLDKSLLAERTLTISASGVHSLDDASEILNRWPAVNGIEMDDRFIVVYEIKPNFMYLIPQAAFASDDEADWFYSKATAYCEAAHAHVSAEATLVALDPNNPYQAPMSQ
jgi:hypothetical protein